MAMESSEEEEYFETLDKIPSASASDISDSDTSVEDGSTRCRENSRCHSGFPPWDPKYSIWRNEPESIKERRRRLFHRMGLQEEMECRIYETGDASSSLASANGVEAKSQQPSMSSSPSLSKSPSRSSYSGFSRSGSRGAGFLELDGILGSSSQGLPGPSENASNTGDNSQAAGHKLGKCASLKNISRCSSQHFERLVDSNSAMSLRKPPFIQEARSDSLSLANMSASSSSVSFADSTHGRNSSSVEGWRSSVESNGEFICRIKDLDSGKEFIVHELGTDGLWNKLREVGTGKELSLEEFESSLGLSPAFQRKADGRERNSRDNKDMHKKTRGFLKGFRSAIKKSRQISAKDRDDSISSETSSLSSKEGMALWNPQRIKVQVHGKKNRELTDLLMGQNIKAHDGPIWTMKFSLDGCYLASGGQDCVVRIWEVIETEVSIGNECEDTSIMSSADSGKHATHMEDSVPNYQENDTSKLHAIMSGSVARSKRSRKKSGIDSTTFLSKVFRLSEKPTCCLQGHTEDILDLSWSRSQFLLSSSMDKTVRLWHITDQDCLQVFSHNSYVTCIQFNPVDDKHFLSGALDGKVRIWSILNNEVIDWTDLRETVTAICYTSDGKGARVGTYKGTCRFYNIIDNKLELDTQFNVLNKGKRSRGKKITGLQCMPGSSRKVLVTSNDSRIRLYDGVDMVSKYKGFRNVSSQISATFSARGDFIISASEDSHVYVWNVMNLGSPSLQLKVGHSYEHFLSSNVTVAIAWPGADPRGTVGKEIDVDGNCYRQQSPASEAHLQNMSRRKSSFPIQYFHCLAGGIAKDADGERAISGRQNANGLKGPADVFREAPLDAPTISSVSAADTPDRSIWKKSIQGMQANTMFSSDQSKSSATWPEEKLLVSVEDDPGNVSVVPEVAAGKNIRVAGWGMVILTASLGGEIRTFQNYGLPLHP